jgi:HK97 gp10 family phage protein
MADLFSVDVIGADEFHKFLVEMARSLPNEKVEPILMEGVKIVADAARANAPRGPTGNLKKGVKTKFLKQIGAYPRSAAAVSNAPHDHWFEYGTAPRTQKTTGDSTGAMPARPFFRPAVDANKGRVQDLIINKLWALVSQKWK